ncbi:MAG: DUF6134 family protein [Alphaproteobacteria bacterium]|nr:DUF6134 family protein [Alphaproteobacteria bacterium]
MTVPRRAFIMTGLAGALSCVCPRIAGAATAIVLPTAASDRRFSVLYEGDKIGAHTISYSAATGQTRVTTKIDLVVKALFFTAFAYSHRSEEIWRDGRLISLSSETVEDGETLFVAGAATPKGFRGVSKAGPFMAASGALTSNSLWTPAVLEQETVIDAQHGGVIGVSARKIGDEEIMIAGRRTRATHYRFITPYLAGSIWYDESSRWMRGDFERDGSNILYRLDD